MKQLNITDLQILNKQFGDGFYLLDSDVFLNNYKNLTEEFKNHYSNFNIAYSYKTNYLPKLGKIVNEQGGFAEVVSEMELEIAKKAGVSFDRIIWNGPIKNREVLRAFLLNGGCSNIDNLDEWLYISDLVDKNTDKTFNVGIRCNFDVGDGVLSRFGVDTESVDFITICKGIASKKNVNLTSLQCHFAKRNSSYWQKRTQTMLDIYDRLKADFDLQAERIDLGGALSGDMSEDFAKQIGATSYGYKAFADASATLFADHFKNEVFKPILLIEPGTAVAADCMRVVFKVMNIKTVKDKSIATVFGSQKNISMQGINPPMSVVHGNGVLKDYTNLGFAGYTCIESDYLYKGYNGKLAEGDFIILENCGSYSVVMKPPFILPNFPIIDISSGIDNVELIKRAETFDDLFLTYNF